MEPIKLPRDLDKPQTVLFMTAEDLIIFSILFVIGMMLSHPFPFGAFGLGLVFVFRRFREGRSDGYLLHVLYWIGLLPVKGKSVVNPFQRTIYPQ